MIFFDFNWNLVREAHKAVLLAIEKGALNPNDLQGMEAKRKSALDRAFRHQSGSTDAPSGSSSNVATLSKGPTSCNNPSTPGLLLRICKQYNEGKCSFEKEHQKGAYLWTHICGFCWHRLKQKRNHQEKDCESKKKDMSKTQKKRERGDIEPPNQTFRSDSGLNSSIVNCSLVVPKVVLSCSPLLDTDICRPDSCSTPSEVSDGVNIYIDSISPIANTSPNHRSLTSLNFRLLSNVQLRPTRQF